mgnify:CR=1 FL=1
MVVFEKDKRYMEVLSAFRKLIDTEFKDGGWLPPVREMSERLNVSTVTYRKAVSRLIAESMAVSYPRKGIYITPRKYCLRKVGLVIGNGEESPFLFGEEVLLDIISKLKERGYCCHQIQGNSEPNVARNALSHCVSGVIWLTQCRPDVQALRDILANALFPLVCIQWFHPDSEEDVFPADIPCVMEDYAEMGETLAEPFLRRGHRKLACVGASYWREEYIGLAAAIRRAGLAFDHTSCLEDCVHSPGKLTGILLKQGITGLFLHGGSWQIESTFRELSELPDELQPEILVWDNPMLPQIAAKYPAVKIIALARDNSRKFGGTAVDMLLDHLDDPKKIVSAKVSTFQVSCTEQFFAASKPAKLRE